MSFDNLYWNNKEYEDFDDNFKNIVSIWMAKVLSNLITFWLSANVCKEDVVLFVLHQACITYYNSYVSKTFCMYLLFIAAPEARQFCLLFYSSNPQTHMGDLVEGQKIVPKAEKCHLRAFPQIL